MITFNVKVVNVILTTLTQRLFEIGGWFMFYAVILGMLGILFFLFKVTQTYFIYKSDKREFRKILTKEEISL